MIFENLQKAFELPLIELGETENVDVYLENISETPSLTGEQMFIAGYLLDTDLTPAEIAVSEQITTLYQIDAVQLSKNGTADINRMIDKIRAGFHANSHHEFGGDCFDVLSVSVSRLMDYNGFKKKSITLSISGFTQQL